MKRIHALLAMMLALAIAFVLMTPASVLSEATEGAKQGDNSSLYADLQMPVSYDTQIGQPSSSGDVASEHTVNCSIVSSEDSTMMIEATFLTYNRTLTENEWSDFSAKLEDLILSLMKTEGMGASEDVPARLMSAIERQRGSGESLGDELFLSRDIVLSRVQITYPYYVDLTNGSRGSAVYRLQNRLIELGFLSGSADGQFGGNTKAAVESAQAHVRAYEQALIDANKAPEPEAEDVEPETTLPETVVDGIASIRFQALLFSDAFPVAPANISADEKGDHVVRLQKRLIALGYMLGAADGQFGGNSQRGMLLFQTENDLSATGSADVDSLKLLFSDGAKAAEYPLMGVGSGGDDVKALQARLRDLGFMTGSADGSFGESTRQGVENLQTYMRAKEADAIRNAGIVPAMKDLSSDEDAAKPTATVAPVDESALTIQVNGIADTVLLKAFYHDSFTAIPAAMNRGDSGLDVMRVQRRLNQLEYLFGGVDGSFGGGTTEALKKFQSRNGLSQSGAADRETLTKLFSDKAQKALKPYVLKISVADQRVYAYGLDSSNEYTVLVRTMKCSTGLKATPTITGTFQSTTGPGARWHYFKKFKCWAQYAYYIQGDYMLHSVLYNQKNGPVTQSSVNNLGRRASHGCVRLSVEDAKWVYNNCPRQTKIIVY